MIKSSGSAVASFLQDYLNIEIVNLIVRTSETRDMARSKLERMGQQIGEKYTELFFLKTPLPDYQPNLKGVEDYFVNGFWPAVFKGRCNSSGIDAKKCLVLEDTHFSWISKISLCGSPPEELSIYLAMPCGILRGAVKALGFRCKVSGETDSTAVKCKFAIQFA
ncbi:putative trafficking protein particle complex subunit 6 [Monocercomonoides exilis]|uniref:putative trafficking protein particle complex subunit 6 n=1 Tax=Monocercomonoides exilis TaxID=2049356 RepID=UPI003559DCD9|nr:putative trafficking protein particle complex subunit 6 [Monocercomonoides exilis]